VYVPAYIIRLGDEKPRTDSAIERTNHETDGEDEFWNARVWCRSSVCPGRVRSSFGTKKASPAVVFIVNGGVKVKHVAVQK